MNDMKRTLYYLLAIFTVLCATSCNDDEKELSSLTGDWEYTRPHFEFEYASDSIVFEMYQGRKLAVATEEIKETYLRMATVKMQDYFQGIEVISASEIHIIARMQTGESFKIGAGYNQTAEFIEVSLNRNDMQQLLGENAGMIPAVSFRYTLQNGTLTMYFDEAYVRTIYAMMEPRIVPMIVDNMGIDFSHMPEGVRQQVIDGVKKQIPLILEQIERLEIGFVLTKA